MVPFICLSVHVLLCRLCLLKYVKSFTRWQHMAASVGLIVRYTCYTLSMFFWSSVIVSGCACRQPCRIFCLENLLPKVGKNLGFPVLTCDEYQRWVSVKNPKEITKCVLDI